MDNSDLQHVAPTPMQGVVVDVLYFARLREALKIGRERIALPLEVRTVGALRDHLSARGEAWACELAHDRPVRIAVNQDIARPDTALHSGDEVAFFPPVTGG